MSTDETLDKLLGALSHPVRRRALALLSSNEELCVCELMATLGVTQSRMSRHMSTLKSIGLVLERRDAQWVRYRRNPNTPATVARIVDLVLNAMPKETGLAQKEPPTGHDTGKGRTVTDDTMRGANVEESGSTMRWLAGVAGSLVAWAVLYSQLVPFSEWFVSLLPIERTSQLGEAIAFFVYDTPKVLLLLTLVVFAMGVVRSFFSPEHTRALLSGKREGVGNVMAAALGIVTPFCSCSAVPIFIGFVSAGIPLGVTFSFLIAAPMVNEVALGLLFGLVGWKIALTYLTFGLSIAIVAGWVIGRLGLEDWLEDWVKDLRSGAAEDVAIVLSPVDRIRAGLDAVRDIVGRVWPWLIAGIAAGAFIHGYVPSELLASVMGKRDVVVSACRRSHRHSHVLQRRRYHSRRGGIDRQRCRYRHCPRLYDGCDCPLSARDDHPAKSAEP